MMRRLQKASGGPESIPLVDKAGLTSCLGDPQVPSCLTLSTSYTNFTFSTSSTPSSMSSTSTPRSPSCRACWQGTWWA